MTNIPNKRHRLVKNLQQVNTDILGIYIRCGGDKESAHLFDARGVSEVTISIQDALHVVCSEHVDPRKTDTFSGDPQTRPPNADKTNQQGNRQFSRNNSSHVATRSPLLYAEAVTHRQRQQNHLSRYQTVTVSQNQSNVLHPPADNQTHATLSPPVNANINHMVLRPPPAANFNQADLRPQPAPNYNQAGRPPPAVNHNHNQMGPQPGCATITGF